MPSASIFQPAPCQRVSSHRKVWAENTSQNGWCNKVCNRVWQIFRARPAFLLGKTDPCCPETGRTSFPRSRAPQGRAGLADAPLSPRPHFRFCRPRVRYASGWIIQCPGNSSLFVSLVFRRVAGMQLAGGFHRKPSVADRSDAEPARNTGSCPVGRAAGLHPSRRLVDRRRRHPIPLGRIRQSYVSLCGEHTRPGVAISPSRGLRFTDRVSDRLPAARSLPTEGSSRAKAGTSGHMIRNGDGLRVVSGISVRFPFSARRGRPLRAA